MAGLDDRTPEYRRDHKLCTGANHGANRFRIEHRSSTKEKPLRQRRREAADQLDGARDRHRDFEGADAALDNGVHHRAQFSRIAQADDRHDPELFDLSNRCTAIEHDLVHTVLALSPEP